MNYLLISSLNNQIQIINILDEEEVIKFIGHANSGHLVDLCFVNNNSMDDENGKTFLISGSEDGKFYYWDVMESEGRHINMEGYLDGNHEENQSLIVNCISSNNNGLVACAGYPKSDNNIYFYRYNFNTNN